MYEELLPRGEEMKCHINKESGQANVPVWNTQIAVFVTIVRNQDATRGRRNWILRIQSKHGRLRNQKISWMGSWTRPKKERKENMTNNVWTGDEWEESGLFFVKLIGDSDFAESGFPIESLVIIRIVLWKMNQRRICCWPFFDWPTEG